MSKRSSFPNVSRWMLSSVLLWMFVPRIVHAGDILYPWRASPTVVVQGESFEVLFDNQLNVVVDSIVLEGPYNRAAVVINHIDKGKHSLDPYTGVSVTNKITVDVPPGTPEELYDLVLFSANNLHRSIRSVKVIKEYKKQHQFIHISDPHVSRQWVGSPDDGYAKELELFDRFVAIANIIAPDFIIVTGDLIHDYTRHGADSLGWGGITHFAADEKPFVDEKFRNYYEGAKGFKGVSSLNSPTFSIPGNHDFYGLNQQDHLGKATQWNRLNGKRVYGLSYGSTRVLFMDDFLGDPVVDVPDNAPLSGLQGAVLKEFLANKGAGQLRILAQHRPDRIDTAFCKAHDIRLVLNGHNHRPYHEVNGQIPLLNTRPGSISRSGSVSEWNQVLGFFRVFTVEGDDFSFTEALRIVNNPISAYEELEPNMTLTYEKPNDGSQMGNEAVIVNNFAAGFRDCAIRLVMKKGNYVVEGAEVKQVIENDDVAVLDVSFDLKANETKKIIVYKN